VKGCGAGASERQREHGPACFDRKIGDRTNRRRPGIRGCHGPKPTMAAQVPGRAGSPCAINVAKRGRKSGRSRARSARLGTRAATEKRGRQRFIRSGEASSADGRRRSAAAAVAPRCRPHAAPARVGRSLHGTNPCYPAVDPLLRERQGPPPETDSIRTMPQRRRARAEAARLGRKAEQESVLLGAPASK